MNNREKNGDQCGLERWMADNWLVILMIVLLCIAISMGIYLAYFYMQQQATIFPMNNNRGEWGATGDFFGGILNPIFSFLGLMILLATLYQSQKELRETRVFLKKQTEIQERQRFEGAFFSMLDKHDGIFQASKINEIKINWCDDFIKTKNDLHEIIKNNGHGVYLNYIYNMLNFIDDQYVSSDKSQRSLKEERMYIATIKNTISRRVIDVIFVYLLPMSDDKSSNNVFSHFKSLVEKYSLFDEMLNEKVMRERKVPIYFSSPHPAAESIASYLSPREKYEDYKDKNRRNLINKVLLEGSYEKSAYGDSYAFLIHNIEENLE